MRVWYFSEQSYTPVWDTYPGPLRIEMPSEICDPKIASDIINTRLDEFMAADELGFDIMLNEHHTNATCLSATIAVPLSILARQTKRARLLCLGTPITNRPDPFRVAEELAQIDVISRGRLEIGMVKASPWELYISNMNPAGVMDRFWEAHDLIVKALTTRDGPFSWEGQFFQYRFVNVWPRCYQDPMPPIWIPTTGPGSARQVAQKGYTLATFLAGYFAKVVFDGYREEYLKVHGRTAPPERLAYMGLVAVGNNQREAAERAEKSKQYLKSIARVGANVKLPPGYAPVPDVAKAMMAGSAGSLTRLMSDGRPLPQDPSLDDYASAGMLFWGTPDRVYEQIKKFHDGIGGFGNLLMMGQAGPMTNSETLDSIKLFAKEIYPRLKELNSAEIAA